MTTGGVLVMVIGLLVAAGGWFAALFTHRQVVEHKRKLAIEAAKADPARR